MGHAAGHLLQGPGPGPEHDVLLPVDDLLCVLRQLHGQEHHGPAEQRPENEPPADLNNTQLIQLSYQLLRIYIFGFIIMGAFSTFQQTYNALGCGKNAFFFAFFRKIILLIPLIYLLPFILPSYGVYAVVLAEPISDLMTTILNGIYFKHFVKKTLA